MLMARPAWREGREMAVSLSFVKKISPKSIDGMAIAEVVYRVEALNQGIAKFWSKSDGWAPVAAAGLLGKSRLDWQASLSGSLRLWMREPPNALTPAELILAWANLGSLVEGTIKTLLSVWYETYKADIEIGRASCRERECQYVSTSAVAVSFIKK